MTTKELISAVQMYMGDLAGRGVAGKRPFILHLLNEGQRLFVTETKYIGDTWNIYTKPDIDTFTLPGGFMQVERVLCRSTLTSSWERLDHFTDDEIDRWYGPSGTSKGRPARYWIDQRRGFLGLHPMPLQGYYIKVHYTRLPAELSDNEDVPEMPEQRHQALVEYALWKIYRIPQYRDDSAAVAHMYNFKACVNSSKTDDVDQLDRASTIRDTAGMMRPYATQVGRVSGKTAEENL